MSDDTIPLDKLAKVYRKIKQQIDLLTQEYDTKVEVLKAQQDEIRFAMKDQMKTLGVKSVSTAFGTVSLIHKTRYSTEDWESFDKFVVENDVPALFERRIAQSNMAKYLEENPTRIPPGLSTFSDFEIRVTKPSK